MQNKYGTGYGTKSKGSYGSPSGSGNYRSMPGRGFKTKAQEAADDYYGNKPTAPGKDPRAAAVSGYGTQPHGKTPQQMQQQAKPQTQQKMQDPRVSALKQQQPMQQKAPQAPQQPQPQMQPVPVQQPAQPMFGAPQGQPAQPAMQPMQPQASPATVSAYQAGAQQAGAQPSAPGLMPYADNWGAAQRDLNIAASAQAQRELDQYAQSNANREDMEASVPESTWDPRLAAIGMGAPVEITAAEVSPETVAQGIEDEQEKARVKYESENLQEMAPEGEDAFSDLHEGKATQLITDFDSEEGLLPEHLKAKQSQDAANALSAALDDAMASAGVGVGGDISAAFAPIIAASTREMNAAELQDFLAGKEMNLAQYEALMQGLATSTQAEAMADAQAQVEREWDAARRGEWWTALSNTMALDGSESWNDEAKEFVLWAKGKGMDPIDVWGNLRVTPEGVQIVSAGYKSDEFEGSREQEALAAVGYPDAPPGTLDSPPPQWVTDEHDPDGDGMSTETEHDPETGTDIITSAKIVAERHWAGLSPKEQAEIWASYQGQEPSGINATVGSATAEEA